MICPICKGNRIEWLSKNIAEIHNFNGKTKNMQERADSSVKIKRLWFNNRTLNRVIGTKKVTVYNAYCGDCNSVQVIGDKGKVAIKHFQMIDSDKDVLPEIIKEESENVKMVREAFNEPF